LFRAVEMAEVDKRGDTLLHRRQIVQAAKAERRIRRKARMKMVPASGQPRSDRSHPSVDVPPWRRTNVFDRRKIPECPQPFEPLFAAVTRDQRGHDRAGRRSGDPMQRHACFRKRLPCAGVVGGKPEAAGKNHCNNRSVLHRSTVRAPPPSAATRRSSTPPVFRSGAAR
jgi:hypothetical protein